MDISLIVPTLNRSGFVIRLLRYYADNSFKGRILIGDSSGPDHADPTKAEIEKLKDLLVIEYYDCVGLDSNASFLKLCSNVETKYCAYLGDDDFLVPAGIAKCISFLEKNPDYSAAHGKAACFRTKSGAADGSIKIAAPYYMSSNEFEKPSDRIANHLADYSVTIFAVHRTIDWLIMWQDIDRVPDRAFGAELLPCCLSVVLGKTKRIKCLYLLRQSHDYTYHLPTFYEWVTSPEWNPSYQVFKDVLTYQLSIKEGISETEAEVVIKNGFRLYLFGFQRTLFGRLKNRVWFSLVYPNLKKLAVRFPSAKPLGGWTIRAIRILLREIILFPKRSINRILFLFVSTWSFVTRFVSFNDRNAMRSIRKSAKKNKQQ